MSMIERVAQNICAEAYSLGMIDSNWVKQSADTRDGCRCLAKAAIAAMTEATDDMAKAAMLADDKRTGNQTCRHIYRAMIDAALRESKHD